MGQVANEISMLDPKEWVGALRGSIDAYFHPDHAETDSGNMYKQVVYDCGKEWENVFDEAEMQSRLDEEINSLQEKAKDAGNDWLVPQLEDVRKESKGAFPLVEDDEDDDIEAV